ncbi:hypothetical protein AXF42_Ash013860 [Apostasia shenzhenica]|uniref:Uncharacterized protein n=1 Tax=Apostasia shenzhenica TaxID=1088818 RepID=A0A2I0AS22_9ASPA|nr:hypothetical protein AXF42_Ash013860 [Apostasia shenzhenica]
MSSAKQSAKRRGKNSEALGLEKKRREEDDLDIDLDLSSDIRGIISALQQIRDKAQMDEKRKNEETITRSFMGGVSDLNFHYVATEVKSITDEAKLKYEKERQNFLRALSKSCKEFENSLKNEHTKFQAACEKFNSEKAAYIQLFKEIFSKHELENEKLFVRYEQMRKKEKTALVELEKSFAEKITSAEETLQKKKQVHFSNIPFPAVFCLLRFEVRVFHHV